MATLESNLKLVNSLRQEPAKIPKHFSPGNRSETSHKGFSYKQQPPLQTVHSKVKRNELPHQGQQPTTEKDPLVVEALETIESRLSGSFYAQIKAYEQQPEPLIAQSNGNLHIPFGYDGDNFINQG